MHDETIPITRCPLIISHALHKQGVVSTTTLRYLFIYLLATPCLSKAWFVPPLWVSYLLATPCISKAWFVPPLCVSYLFVYLFVYLFICLVRKLFFKRFHNSQFWTDSFHITRGACLRGLSYKLCSSWRFANFWRFRGSSKMSKIWSCI